MRTKIIILTSLFLMILNSFSQNPGGVQGLSSWFKASEDIYVNAGITPALNTGDLVAQWNNLVVNANLPNLNGSGGARTLLTNHAYYNFNDVIQLSGGSFTKQVPAYDAIFNTANGAAAFSCASQKGMSFSFSSGSASPCGSNRCNTGFRWAATNLSNKGRGYLGTFAGSRANILGVWGISNISHNNLMNGTWNSGGNVNAAISSQAYTYGVGYFPGYNYTGIISEVFTYNRTLSNLEVSKIQSYMGVKYGVTLDVNGVSLDYLSSTGSTVWNATNNNGYAYDVAGIARDDNSGLMQLKSHSVNNTSMVFDDILTVAYGNNFSSPAIIANNESFMMWANNGLSYNCDSSDVGYTQSGLLIGERLEKTWKVQETGTIGIATLEFDMDNVSMGSLATSDYRLLIDNDGVFGNGSIALSPSSIDLVNNKMYFTHDFTAASGWYFSVGIPKVEITISGSTTICDGDSTQLTFNYTGTNGPIDITYFDGLSNVTVSNYLPGGTVTVFPSATTAYTVLQQSVSSCFNPIYSATVIVNPIPLVDLGPDIDTCGNYSITLSSPVANSTYLWQDNSTDSTLQPLVSGMYWLEVNLNGCTERDSINILYNTVPSIVINATDTILCDGENTTLTALGAMNYVWDNGVQNSIAFTPINSNTFTVIGTALNGCEDTAQVNVIVNPNPIVTYAAVDTILCVGESIGLTGEGALNYLWDNGVSDNTPFIPLSTNLYTVIGTNIYNCSDTNQVNVIVNPIPNIEATTSKALICEGESVVLTASGGDTYVWDNNITNEVPFSPDYTNTYTVIGTNQFGCQNSDQIFIDVIPFQEVEIVGDATVCLEPTVVEVDDVFASYVWQDGSTSYDFSTSEEGTYSVVVTDIYGCLYSAEIDVVEDCMPVLYAPNAFTPNGDGDNDVFAVQSELIEDFEMTIYDRWGQLLYKTHDIFDGWNGITSSGTLAPVGVYVYKLKYNYYEKMTKLNKTQVGQLTLIR